MNGDDIERTLGTILAKLEDQGERMERHSENDHAYHLRTNGRIGKLEIAVACIESNAALVAALVSIVVGVLSYLVKMR